MPEPTLPARGSLRSRGAAGVSHATLRQISAVLPPEQAWGLWASRQIVARVMDTFGPSLAGTRVEPVDVRLADGRRVVGEWVRSARATDHSPAIYYIHGSGYALCSPRTHRRLTAWLSRLTGMPVFCIDYRLAPKYRFPTAADDVRAGWDWLRTDCGHDPDRMVIAGDSAGGHLAVDLLLQPDNPHPAAMALFSPLFDLTFGLARAREALRDDPAIRAADAARLIGLYCAGTDLDHPRLTLDVSGGRRMPPTLIQAGGAEMLQADARTLDAQIRAAGGHSELQIWPDQVHVFQALPRLTPEAAPAMRTATAFISKALQGNQVVEVAG
ncbi:alpha/beta hydrolase [Mycobacterium sp. AMU20-3851]|uniref:alpha/beta hydrolase n=1 Tax=Mycobacterium sp. AMU20-3851 TaxID=3122055 RepID=UPI0037549CF3